MAEDLQYCDIEGFENYIIYSDGRVFSKYKRIFLSPRMCRGGYSFVNLYQSRKMKSVKIHRLVALHFIPNPANKPCVDHIDGDKSNNHVSNLRWATISENSKYQKKPSNNTSGEKNVYYRASKNHWRVSFTANGKNKEFGTFKDYNDAVAFARQKREELYGEFCRHE